MAWVLLPVAAWLVATLWLGGDVGKSTDDYSINLRDPVTGALPSPFDPWVRYPFFWRPLHIAMCFGAGSLFAEHWRVLAVFCAVMHGVACGSVYALLRAGTRSRGPAAVGAMVILLHPMNFEVPFWFSSISTAIATALWCGLALWCIRLVQRERGPRAMELLGVAALGLTVPCFYEQPATGVLALPLILLAAWLRSRVGPRLAPAFWRAILLCGVVGAMNAVYIVLLRITAPSTFRGGSGSFVTGDRVVDRIGEVARSVRWQLHGSRLRETAMGAWETGVDALMTPVGVAAIGVLIVLVIVWAWAWTVEPGNTTAAESGDERAASRDERRRTALARFCWIGAGLVLFVGSFIPIALMIRQNVEPRTLYFPLVGLCMILTQAIDLLLAASRRIGGSVLVPRILRGSVAVMAGAAVIAGAVCSVGVQTWCSRRGARDEAIAARLAELVPDPPPNAAYLPLRLDAGATPTGRVYFDRLRPAAFAATWSATTLMQHATRRADVAAACVNPWAEYPYDRFSDEGLWFCTRLNSLAVDPRGKGEFIPWERAIPFVVEDDGRVRLVRQIEITRADDRVETYTVPVVRAAIRAGDAKGHATTISLTDASDALPAFVTGWRWMGAAGKEPGESVTLQTLNSRGTRREGAWLHPAYQEGTRRGMQAMIEPPTRAVERVLRFRVTTPPEDYVRFAGAMPVTVVVEVLTSAEAAEPLASVSVELTREMAEAETAWKAVDLRVPATDTPLVLRVHVVGSGKGPHAPVWVTPGMWVGEGR